MRLEYVSTNDIYMFTQDYVDKYLELCRGYFSGHITNPEITPINKEIYDALE